jgi:hypothetical protein
VSEVWRGGSEGQIGMKSRKAIELLESLPITPKLVEGNGGAARRMGLDSSDQVCLETRPCTTHTGKALMRVNASPRHRSCFLLSPSGTPLSNPKSLESDNVHHGYRSRYCAALSDQRPASCTSLPAMLYSSYGGTKVPGCSTQETSTTRRTPHSIPPTAYALAVGGGQMKGW